MAVEKFVATQDRVLFAEYAGTSLIDAAKIKIRKYFLFITATIAWVRGTISSAIILSLLIFIVVNFYIFSSIATLNTFFYSFLILSMLTDGVYMLLHLFRRPVRHPELHCDPTKLTVIIACHNGAETIGETIRQASKHVLLNRIIVVSDASTDKTAQIARMAGTRVLENKFNLQKAMSINRAMRYVRTPYVLLLDDDTFIGDATIPTNLLDEGYNAVAFNIVPISTKTLVNDLQQFEYRKSMLLGKSGRASTGSIGNVSGAIGLFRTRDLIMQVTRHSGQFAGEDEQRTMLVHLMSKGKGITYVDTPVYTQAPATYKELYHQRAYKWAPALPEMFSIYWRILLSSRYHYLLKAEKAYELYYFFTDPLRLLFLWTLVTKSSHLAILYAFYLLINVPVWARLRKVKLRTILFFPAYSLFLIVCRLIGHLYWFSIKFRFLSQKLYRYVEHRRLRTEYAFIAVVIVVMWGVSATHFIRDESLLHKLQSHTLNNDSPSFSYAPTTPYISAVNHEQTAPVGANYLLVPVDPGDTPQALAYKSIMQYLVQQSNVSALQVDHEAAYTYLATKIPQIDTTVAGSTVPVQLSDIQAALQQEGNHP